jgi:hypothetical protein
MGIYQAWAKERSSLAQSLGRGELGGSYADGAIILCAAISAMASLLWEPSSKKDAKRFVEIVTRFRTGGPDTTRVSAPLLAAEFPQLRHGLGVSEKSFYLTGRMDKMEAEVRTMCAAANIPDAEKAVRRYSYASLLYKQVRCGFIHEYQPGKGATEGDGLRGIAGVEGDEISYVNMLEEDDGVLVVKRLIHFPLGWISAVLLAVAAGIDDERSRQEKTSYGNLGLSIPNAWWVDGGP